MVTASRIGKKIINLPEGVKVDTQGSKVVVTGPKGELSFDLPEGISLEAKDSTISVKSANVSGARFGRARAELANKILGVTQGWTKTLEIVGTGFRATTDGSILTLNLGFSHQVVVQAPEGINFAVAQTKVTISGTDKQLVGQIAANIRQFRQPEPYKGKGIKYEGELIRKKAGKAAKGATTA